MAAETEADALPFGDDTDSWQPNEQFGQRAVPLTEAECAQAEADPALAFQEIMDGLFLGPYSSTCNLGALAAAGITHLLNLSMKPSTVARQHPGMKATLDVDGLFDNHTADIAAFLPRCLDFLLQARADGGRVLVNCQQGISRSASIVCAYLLLAESDRFSDWPLALVHIQTLRPCVSPNDRFRGQVEAWISQHQQQKANRLE